MPSEYERVIVHSSHRRGSRSADVGENSFARCIGTYAAEVGIVKWRLSVFVKCGALASNPSIVEVCCCRGVPGYTKTVDVEEAVTNSNLVLCSNLIGIVGEKFGKEAVLVSAGGRDVSYCDILFVDLLGKGMSLSQ